MVRQYTLEFNKARSSPELLENFREYLQRSYCPESLEFLLTVDKDFKLVTEPEIKIANAKTIVDTFIKTGSRLEINVDVFTKRRLTQLVEELNEESPELDTFFSDTYKLVYIELKNDSFVRYMDSEMFRDFSRKKGDSFILDLCRNEEKKQPYAFSPFNVNGNIQDLDVQTLLRMTEDISDYAPLQITKKYDREKDYYSYLSRTKYPLDGICPGGRSAKFVGILPVSAEQALYVLLDREYRSKWEPFVKYQVELPINSDGDYDQTVCYAEIKLMAFMTMRYSAGNTTVLYDSERRCYIWISKTTTAIDNTPLKKAKKPIPGVFISIYVVYKISESRCRYVTCNHSWINTGSDPSDTLLKYLLKKRGKYLFENWLKLSRERIAKYGSERPRYCPELETLETFMQKYLPDTNCTKTW